MTDTKRTRITVSVGNETFTFRGDLEPERIRQIVSFFDERLKQTERTYPQLSPAKSAILAGLNLAEEHIRLQEDYRQLLSMVQQSR